MIEYKDGIKKRITSFPFLSFLGSSFTNETDVDAVFSQEVQSDFLQRI